MRGQRALVEHLFAQTKANSGFWRFSAWGLKGARLQWLMLCLVNNLKKIHPAKNLRPGTSTASPAIKSRFAALVGRVHATLSYEDTPALPACTLIDALFSQVVTPLTPATKTL